MAWTYNGDLSTDLDKTRFYIGDTDTTAQLFTDAEINGVLAVYPSPMLAAASLADAQAAKYSRRASVSVDGASFQYSDLARNFSTLAARLRAQAASSEPGGLGTPFVGGVSQGDMDAVKDDDDREPGRFEVGMQDAPGLPLSPSHDDDLVL